MSQNRLKLLCILAHPDDESMGLGGILARYADEGVATSVITATRGQRGWFGPADENPGMEALGEIREAELMQAADLLGVTELIVLDYVDGELDQADVSTITREIAAEIRRIRPHVVVTFDPTGAYGHPDHIAISQFALGAVMAAANSAYSTENGQPVHQVSKFYYLVERDALFRLYQEAFGELMMEVDGVERRPVAWPEWLITSYIATGAYWKTAWEAISCHQSQLPGYGKLATLPDEFHQALWETQTFYRAFSLVNGGRTPETDLFAGIRERVVRAEK